jgi:hypothetical protein
MDHYTFVHFCFQVCLVDKNAQKFNDPSSLFLETVKFIFAFKYVW